MKTWRDVVGYEGLYEVSNTGEVRSKDRFRRAAIKHVTVEKIKGKTLKQALKSNGYLSVDLCKDGRVTTTSVHRIVAEAFVPKPDSVSRMIVNHKDGNKQHNYIENLEWITYKGNRRHAIQHGLVTFDHFRKKVMCIETGIRFKSSKNAAEWLKANYPECITTSDLRIVENNIRGSIRGRTPKAYGFSWLYIEGSTTIPKGSTHKRVEMGDPSKRG